MKRKRFLVVSYIPSQSLILIRTHLSSLIEGTISGLFPSTKKDLEDDQAPAPSFKTISDGMGYKGVVDKGVS
jgi:hypothetical protein